MPDFVVELRPDAERRDAEGCTLTCEPQKSAGSRCVGLP